MASAQWQATRWPAGTPGRSTTRSCGRSSSQRVSWRHGQRVWNRHPVGGFDGRGQVAGEQDLLAAVLDHRVGHRHGGQQRPGVGVQRLGVEVVGGGLLDHAAEVHHADPVADVPHHGQVVGDDEVGEVELLLQLVEQVDHLGLHRHVEGRHRLVGDDQLGLDRQRPGDADALALAAGELVRVLASARRPAGPRPTSSSRSRFLVDGPSVSRPCARIPSASSDSHRLARVEAAHRVLEDHLELLAARPQLLRPSGARRRCRR